MKKLVAGMATPLVENLMASGRSLVPDSSSVSPTKIFSGYEAAITEAVKSTQ